MAAGQMHDAAILAAGTVASRVLGLFRDLLIAHLLGPAADAFVIAFRVPNIFRRLLGEGSLGMAYGAAAVRIIRHGGEPAANAFGRAVCRRVFFLSLLVVLLLSLCAHPLAFALAPGAQGTTIERGAALLRFCLPYMPLSLVAAIAFSHAASLGRFGPQAWSPALLNGCMLAAGLLAYVFNARAGAAEVLLCAGLVFGGMAQALTGLRCFTFLSRPLVAPDPAQIRTLFRALPASAIGAAPHQVHMLAGMILASFLTSGGISSLYFAERLIEFPLALAGATIGMAALPRLAALAVRGDKTAFADNLRQAIRLSAFLSLPAAAGLFALALPLADALFGHGANTTSSVRTIAFALMGYSPALPALCAARPLLAAAHALNLQGTPLKTALISLLPLVLVSGTGVYACIGDTDAAAFSIGVGLAAGAWTNTVLLLRCLAKEGVALFRPGIWSGPGVYALAALCMGGALFFATTRADNKFGIAALAGLIALCAALWFGFFLLLKSEEAKEIMASFRRSR